MSSTVRDKELNCLIRKRGNICKCVCLISTDSPKRIVGCWKIVRLLKFVRFIEGSERTLRVFSWAYLRDIAPAESAHWISLTSVSFVCVCVWVCALLKIDRFIISLVFECVCVCVCISLVSGTSEPPSHLLWIHHFFLAAESLFL